MPLAEQIDALNEVRQAGKVRHIGVSNFNTALMAEAIRLSDAPLVTNQIEYHPYLNQAKVIEAACEAGLSVTAYYGMADGKVFEDEVLTDIAARHNRSVAQIVLRWLVQQDGEGPTHRDNGEDGVHCLGRQLGPNKNVLAGL